jgi:hypothetical protein
MPPTAKLGIDITATVGLSVPSLRADRSGPDIEPKNT